MIRIGMDTGGTFTDYVATGSFQGGSNRTVMVKYPSDHQQRTKGLLDGLIELAKAWGTDLETLLFETEQIVHGSTLALNALLEKKGVVTALFTTEGFRDALEIRRSQLRDQWNLKAPLPELLVPRRLRLGITERLDYQGSVLTELYEESVRNACKVCRQYGVESIAVCFLFSFLNPDHERRTAEIIREELPEVFVTLSSEVAPKIREYERTSTTVLNAYLTPVLADYLNSLKSALHTYGWNKPLHLIMNSAGLSDSDAMGQMAVKTLFSGPVGGAFGNETLGSLVGNPYTILADMGGTSFDVHVSGPDGAELKSQSEIGGYPLTVPTVDIASIGAGGGSIVQLDPCGRIQVGPRSAGSLPGPACYGMGGMEPTITDVLLVLGYLDETGFLGGRMPLHRTLAERALNERIAAPLGLSITEAAEAIYHIAAEKMADAIRLVTVRKGEDPRKYALIGAGGAFGLFAGPIMEALHMNEVLFPYVGPVFCAWGMLGAPRQGDFVRSLFMEKGEWDPDHINEVVREMKEAGSRELSRLGVPVEDQDLRLSLEMRYVGQHHEISVPWLDDFTNENRDALEHLFHKVHQKWYEYHETHKDWELINITLSSFEKNRENPFFLDDLGTRFLGEQTVAGAPIGEKVPLSVSVYHSTKDGKKSSEFIVGPALLHFDYTTLLIPQGFVGLKVQDGVWSLRRKEER